MNPDFSSVPIDALPTAVVVVEPGDGRIIACNPDLGRLSGRDSDSLLGLVLTELVDPADRDALVAALAALGSGSGDEHAAMLTQSLRARLLPSGTPVTISVRRLSEDPDRVFMVMADRTDEARFEAIVDASADSTLVLTSDGLVVWQRGEVADPDLVRRVGGIGTNPLELVHPEDLPTVLDSFVNALAHPGTRVRSVVRTRASGPGDQWQRVEVSGSSQLRTPGIEGILVQVRNLGVGQPVGSLAETEGQFFSLTDAAPIGIAVGDAFGRTVYLNAAARALLGSDAGESAGVDQETRAKTGPQTSGAYGIPEWVDQIKEPYRAEVNGAIDAAVYEGETTTITVPFVGPGNERRWLRVRVSPRRSAGRQAIGIVTTLEDVTAEVEALADSERLREMLDASSDFVAIVEPNGEVLYLNQATRDLLSRIEAQGGSGKLRELVPDELRREWIRNALGTAGSGDVWRGELELDAGGGRSIPVSVLTVVRRDRDGSIDWIGMLARDISDLKRAEEQLRELATHDYLTGLPNRPLFNDRLQTAVARHRRFRRGVAVMFCDLDGFKEINDERGHAAGDAVLVEVAKRLKRIVRESDTAARVGGDEFVIVCEGVTDSDELASLAERIIDAVCEPIDLPGGEPVRVGISVGIGVAHSRQEQVDPDRLLTLADTAMYRAKARGGNTFRIAALQG
ncbi:MAG: diguanylate cyclase [Acidimicrobiales bacterium]|nr:diguanylate cyclase [Acidimicrobiales bacterium]